MLKLNAFYLFDNNPDAKYQLTEIGFHHVWIKEVKKGTPSKITKESFELNYKECK